MEIIKTAVIDGVSFTIIGGQLQIDSEGNGYVVSEWKELAEWLISEARANKEPVKAAVDTKQLSLPGRYEPTTPVVPLALIPGGVDPYEDRKAVRSGVAPINGIVQEVDLGGIAMESRTVSAGTVKVSI